jgi:hypothetical protein
MKTTEPRSIGSDPGQNLLVRDEDLERGHNLGQRYGLVVQPLLVVLSAVQEDEEVLILALVVNLDLSCFSTSHFD